MSQVVFVTLLTWMEIAAIEISTCEIIARRSYITHKINVMDKGVGIGFCWTMIVLQISINLVITHLIGLKTSWFEIGIRSDIRILMKVQLRDIKSFAISCELIVEFFYNLLLIEDFLYHYSISLIIIFFYLVSGLQHCKKIKEIL